MRRLALLTTAVVAGLASAGPADAGEFRGGLWAGANIASLEIEGEPESERDSRTAGAFGGVIAWRPGESWSLELRPAYVGSGAKVLVEGNQVEIRASYFELPLLVTRDLGSGRARPYLMAGFALGFRSSAEAVFGGQEQDIADDFAGTDTSLRLGAGLRLAKVAGQPFLEVEYARGFKDLNAQQTGLGADTGAIRNRGVQIRAGFSFGFGNN
jgi:hypothetical protein